MAAGQNRERWRRDKEAEEKIICHLSLAICHLLIARPDDDWELKVTFMLFK
jgi:hypothetical protein